MKEDYEKALTQWDLYKSYGEFNFLFEDTIQSFRLFLADIIRTSYEYFEFEDENEEELADNEVDRLLKILMNNMGAFEIVDNCKACFIDFLNQKKAKFGAFIYKCDDGEHTLSQQTYDLTLTIFKKTTELIQLRNIIIHSHYNESLSLPFYHQGNLKGSKDIKTAKGFENRQYAFDIDFFQRINRQILSLQSFVRQATFNFNCPLTQNAEYNDELDKLERMNFKVEKKIE